MKRVREKKCRGKGKAPSIEHPSNGGAPPAKKRKKNTPDPTYVPPEESDKEDPVPAAKRGRGGRGRGRGRGGKGKNDSVASSQLNTSTANKGVKSEHWRPDELEALIKGANHLKPVLKGRFKHASDGVALKKLAWEELKGESHHNTTEIYYIILLALILLCYM